MMVYLARKRDEQILPVPHFFSFRPLERPASHATGRSQCRQECGERGYYHLHRQLNHTLLLHKPLAVALLVGCGSQHIGERSLLLEALLLATDGAHLTLHKIPELEDTLVLEGP